MQDGMQGHAVDILHEDDVFKEFDLFPHPRSVHGRSVQGRNERKPLYSLQNALFVVNHGHLVRYSSNLFLHEDRRIGWNVLVKRSQRILFTVVDRAEDLVCRVCTDQIRHPVHSLGDKRWGCRVHGNLHVPSHHRIKAAWKRVFGDICLCGVLVLYDACGLRSEQVPRRYPWRFDDLLLPRPWFLPWWLWLLRHWRCVDGPLGGCASPRARDVEHLLVVASLPLFLRRHVLHPFFAPGFLLGATTHRDSYSLRLFF